MSYTIRQIAAKLECDACGFVEIREKSGDSCNETICDDWKLIATIFCCPKCLSSIEAILYKKKREEDAKQVAAETEKQAQIAACVHDFLPHGLLAKCWKCGKYR